MGTAVELAERGRLDERVVKALGGRPGHRAFNGLRRSLGAHPESLARSLRRLERLGTVGHDDLGYFLVDASPPVRRSGPPIRVREIASVRLPPGLDAESLLGLLAGQWFGPVRWVGTVDGDGAPSLVWGVPGAAGQLVARWTDGRLVIAAETPGSTAEDPALERAGAELLWHSLRRIRNARSGGGGDPAPSSSLLAFARGEPPGSASPWAG